MVLLLANLTEILIPIIVLVLVAIMLYFLGI